MYMRHRVYMANEAHTEALATSELYPKWTIQFTIRALCNRLYSLELPSTFPTWDSAKPIQHTCNLIKSGPHNLGNHNLGS